MLDNPLKTSSRKKRPVLLRVSLLSSSIALLFSPTVQGKDYFDPSFLTLSGEKSVVDLSAFSHEGGVAEGQYTLSVFVNQQDMGQFTLSFEKNSQNKLAPQLTSKLLQEWGVNIHQIPTLKSYPLTDTIPDISLVIPQATTTLDLARLRLDISIPQVAMDPKYVRYGSPELWEDGITALLFNYNVSAGKNVTIVIEVILRKRIIFMLLCESARMQEHGVCVV